MTDILNSYKATAKTSDFQSEWITFHNNDYSLAIAGVFDGCTLTVEGSRDGGTVTYNYLVVTALPDEPFILTIASGEELRFTINDQGGASQNLSLYFDKASSS